MAFGDRTSLVSANPRQPGYSIECVSNQAGSLAENIGRMISADSERSLSVHCVFLENSIIDANTRPGIVHQRNSRPVSGQEIFSIPILYQIAMVNIH